MTEWGWDRGREVMIMSCRYAMLWVRLMLSEASVRLNFLLGHYVVNKDFYQNLFLPQ